MKQSKEEFFKTAKLPYYAASNVSYFKVISEEETIYVSDIIDKGIMISEHYWVTACSDYCSEITANDFEIKYIQALNKLKERI